MKVETTMTTQITSKFSSSLVQDGLTFKTFTMPLTDETTETFTIVNYKRNNAGEPVHPEAHDIRGWVYDSHGVLICKGFPYTPSEIYDETVEYEGQMQFLPQGAVVRVMKYGGKVLFTTFGSMKAETARYGKSDNFKSLLLRYLDRTEEELGATLFDLEKDFSDVVHVFVVCDPQIMPTFEMETNGFVYYSGAFKQDIPEWSDEQSVDREIRPFLPIALYSFETDAEYESFYELLTLTSSLPTIHFTTHAAERLFDEEEYSLLLVKNGQGTRILSESGYAREKFVDNQPNLELRVCTLLNFHDSYDDQLYRALNLELPTGFETIESRMEAFIASVCYNRREEAKAAVDKILSLRNELVTAMKARFLAGKIKDVDAQLQKQALFTDPKTGEVRPDAKLSKQFNAIVGRLLNMETIGLKHGRNKTGASVFENLLKRENSESLYRMLTKANLF